MARRAYQAASGVVSGAAALVSLALFGSPPIANAGTAVGIFAAAFAANVDAAKLIEHERLLLGCCSVRLREP
jgi:hypothetical protein